MPLAFPVDAPGYLDFPGQIGNYAVINRTQLATPPATLQFTARVRLDSGVNAAGIGGWGSTHAYLLFNTNRTLVMRLLNAGGQSIGATQSAVLPAAAALGVDIWIRGKVTVSSALCEYWYSLDGDNPTWVPLTGGVGTNAGTVPTLGSSNTVVLGSHSTGIAGMDGRLYYFAEHIDGVETIRFDGNQDLAGVVPDAASFAPSVGPVNSVVAVNRVPKAIGQGYATFPGTTGNYLETPDAAALDVTTAMYVILRMRQRDTVPNYFSVPVGKGLVYRVVTGPYGLLFSWGPNDSSYFRASSRTTIDANEQWVWYSIYYDPATGAHKVWYSLADSLTPPAAASWTQSFSVTLGASAVGNSANPLRIGSGWTTGSVQTGPSINGDIGYVSIRTGTGALPVEGVEKLTLSADSFIAVDPVLTTSITATTGQALTVYRNPAPRDTGYVLFPGTVGNDLVVADAATLEITGPTSFVFGLLPRSWLPYTAQTIISKWAAAGQRSYAVMMDTNGCLQFLYSIDGTVFYTLTCPSPVPASTSRQVVRIDTDIVSGFRVVDFWLSPDAGVTWAPLGTRQSGLTGTIFNSTSPLVIGAQYDGRLYGLSIYGSTQSTSLEMLRLASEHIPANTQAGTLALQGGTAIVRRDYVPVDFGYIVLPGTEGNYLTVPDTADGYLTGTVGTVTTPDPGPLPNEFTIVIRARYTGTDYSGFPDVARQLEVEPMSWYLYRTLSNGRYYFDATGDGVWANRVSTFVSAPIPPANTDVATACSISFSGGTRTMTSWTPSGSTWQVGSTATQAGPVPFDSTQVVRIGTGVVGRIYSVELRTGLDPTVGAGSTWTPGYIDFPGGVLVNEGRVSTGITAPPTDASGSMRFECERQATDSQVHAPIGGGYFLCYLPYTDGSTYFYFYDTTLAANGASATPAMMTAAGVPTTGRWQFKVSWTAATDTLAIHGRDPALGRDLMDDSVGWTQIAAVVKAGAQLRADSYFQAIGGGSSWRGCGKMWRAVLEFNGAVRADFDFRYLTANPGATITLPTGQTCTFTKNGTTPLVGTPKVDGLVWKFDANDYPGTGTSYVDPRGRTWTLTNAAAITPKVVLPRATTNFVAEARLVANDWTPPRKSRAIMTRSTGTVGGFGWTFVLSSRGTLMFYWSSNGNSYDNVVESPALGLQAQAAKRVAVSYESGTGNYVRFWTSDDNRTWTRLSETPTSGAMFASTAQLAIGNFFDGALSNASFRTSFGPGGVPIQNTEALLIDQTCLAIDKAATSFTAVTGQTVTIVKTQTAVEETANPGYLYFPGTLGNYATVPATGPAFPAIAGSMTVDIRLAADRWTGQQVVDSTDPPTSHFEGPAQALFGRWSAGNNHAYLVRLSPNGELLFTWTNSTGSTEYTSTTSRPIPGPVNGEYRYLRLTMDMSVASQQTLRLFETVDYGDTWTQIGQPVVTTYPTSGLVQGNGAFWIGAIEGDTQHFGGRISNLRIYNDTSNIEIFRMDQESLRKPDATTVFTEQWGKTITLHQSSTPTISGYVSFDGVSGEYCRATVPNLSTVTSDFTLMVRVNFTGKLLDTEQVLVQKWNTTPASKVLNKQLTTNVATITTKAAHKLAVGNVVFVTGVGAPFDGTVTIATVPTATTFTYAKTNANVASTASEGDVTPLGRSFSLRRKGAEFSFHASSDGMTDDINAVLADVWDDDNVDWGWMAITTNYSTTGAVVTFFTADDVLTPVGTPLVPLPTDWVAQGDPLIFDKVTSLYMDTEQMTFGGAEDGTLSMRGQLSNVSVTNGIGTNNVPGGTEKFGWNINSFAGIAADSGAFTAFTGENVVLEPVGAGRNMKIQPSAPGPTSDLEPSLPGPTTTIIPSPQGPTTTLVRGEDGPTTMLTAAPIGPVTEISSPSLNRPWWPGTETDDTSKWWEQPAFTVQRSIEGQVLGGDYVRGSTNARTQQTAIRYPTTLPGWTAAGVGKGALYSQPINYDTVELEWNVPEQLAISWEKPSTVADITWNEVAIIRAAMGYPSTVNDGQAIMRMTKAQLYPNGYRYDATSHEILTPNQFDPRSPETSAGPGLTPGRWYYYGLFFRVGFDWVRSAVHSCLLPRNHHHADHLWQALPPYYRYLDDNMRGGANDGDLKKWLTIFGYQFDLNREYIESMLDMYHTDFTPMSLLKRIGENFGVKYEPGLGDYSYRALVGRIGFLYRGRGTVGGMRSLVAAAAKCDCDVTQSPNVLLLPDDSEFVNGTGNWAGMHDLTYPKPTGLGVPSAPVAYDKVFFTNGTYGYNPGPTSGKGMMHVYTAPADATLDLLITCGDGKQAQASPNPPLEILPFDVGTPCKPGDVYTFTISCASEFGVGSMQAFLFFFGPGGRPYDFISHAAALGAATPTTGNWAQTSVSGTVPANGAYVVPAIAVVSRAAGSNASRSPYVHFSGASLYYVGNSTQVTSDVFVKTLTLTGPAAGHPGAETDTGAEIIGEYRASPLFDPFYLGEEQE